MNLFDKILDHVTTVKSIRGQKWVDLRQGHVRRVRQLTRLLPQGSLRGSGRDVGTSLDFYLSGPDRLVFRTNYLHGKVWSAHEITAWPTGLSFSVKVRSDYSETPGVNIDDRVVREFAEGLRAPAPVRIARVHQPHVSLFNGLGVSA